MSTCAPSHVHWSLLSLCPLPPIALEFVSKTSRERKRDYVAKRDKYAAGVHEY